MPGRAPPPPRLSIFSFSSMFFFGRKIKGVSSQRGVHTYMTRKLESSIWYDGSDEMLQGVPGHAVRVRRSSSHVWNVRIP